MDLKVVSQTYLFFRYHGGVDTPTVSTELSILSTGTPLYKYMSMD